MPAGRDRSEQRSRSRRRSGDQPADKRGHTEDDAAYDEEQDDSFGAARVSYDREEPGGDGGKPTGKVRRQGRKERAERTAGTKDRTPALSAANAAKAGLRHIVALTGREPAGVTSLEPAEDDGWRVGVEVIEDRRIPSSTDVLALYEARLDAQGDLLAYARKRRYSRGQGGDEG